MNLRAIDLNLLVALEALLAEAHVTRASARLGLSQPATSNALNRLRQLFGDELLVRTATGMRPTPRALELAEPVRQILRQVDRMLASDAGFNPATAERTFTVRMSDILSSLLLPEILSRFRALPGLRLNVLHLPPAETVDALERDEIDVAVSMGLSHSSAICSQTLLQDRMVCILRRTHPAARKKAFTLADFIAHGHLKVSMSPTDLRFVDDVLSQMGHTRNVVVNVPHWLVVPDVLKRTDLLAVMPRQLAATIVDGDLKTLELPFRSAPFAWMMYWHRRNDQSKAIQWLRAHILSVSEHLAAQAARKERDGRARRAAG
ncbi:MAG: LysR family transcriptional regulator [Hyphomicrobiaceae bacterium]|nr:LysR family transcriptional regulator [Hyphomicrobiaceae bacterium]